MLRRFEHRSGAVGLRSALLAELGIPHVFTTRIGPGGSDLCVRDLDPGARAFLTDALDVPRELPLARARQVHAATALVVGPDGPPGGHSRSNAGPARPAPLPRGDVDGDALVTSTARAALMVYTADCVPVLVASSDGRRVAAIHAGWRGLVAGVIEAALVHFEGPGAVAAIGACLSRERCEMGPEVAERFVDAGLGAVVHPGPGDRARVDVRQAARLQLERGGVARIDVADGCTWTDQALFHSHRRDVTHGNRARAGSLGALIAVRR